MQSSQAYQELNKPRRIMEIWDLATGEMLPGGRNTVDLREMNRVSPGRYVMRKPSDEAVRQYQEQNPEDEGGYGGGDRRELKPLAKPLVQPGQALKPHHRIQKPPTGHARTGVIADGIRELDPVADFTKNGLPDRRKVEGKVHFGVTKEEVEAAMKLLASEGGEGEEDEEDKGEEAPPAEEKKDEGAQAASA